MGGDQKASFSGTKGSCQGSKEWKFFAGHPSGGFVWTGCPRTALSSGVTAAIRAFDRCDGELSYSEQLVAPARLVDAFQAIAFAQGVRAWQRNKDETEKWNNAAGRGR